MSGKTTSLRPDEEQKTYVFNTVSKAQEELPYTFEAAEEGLRAGGLTPQEFSDIFRMSMHRKSKFIKEIKPGSDEYHAIRIHFAKKGFTLQKLANAFPGSPAERYQQYLSILTTLSKKSGISPQIIMDALLPLKGEVRSSVEMLTDHKSVNRYIRFMYSLAAKGANLSDSQRKIIDCLEDETVEAAKPGFHAAFEKQFKKERDAHIKAKLTDLNADMKNTTLEAVGTLSDLQSNISKKPLEKEHITTLRKMKQAIASRDLKVGENGFAQWSVLRPRAEYLTDIPEGSAEAKAINFAYDTMLSKAEVKKFTQVLQAYSQQDPHEVELDKQLERLGDVLHHLIGEGDDIFKPDDEHFNALKLEYCKLIMRAAKARLPLSDRQRAFVENGHFFVNDPAKMSTWGEAIYAKNKACENISLSESLLFSSDLPTRDFPHFEPNRRKPSDWVTGVNGDTPAMAFARAKYKNIIAFKGRFQRNDNMQELRDITNTLKRFTRTGLPLRKNTRVHPALYALATHEQKYLGAEYKQQARGTGQGIALNQDGQKAASALFKKAMENPGAFTNAFTLPNPMTEEAVLEYIAILSTLDFKLNDPLTNAVSKQLPNMAKWIVNQGLPTPLLVQICWNILGEENTLGTKSRERENHPLNILLKQGDGYFTANPVRKLLTQHLKKAETYVVNLARKQRETIENPEEPRGRDDRALTYYLNSVQPYDALNTIKRGHCSASLISTVIKKYIKDPRGEPFVLAIIRSGHCPEYIIKTTLKKLIKNKQYALAFKIIISNTCPANIISADNVPLFMEYVLSAVSDIANRSHFTDAFMHLGHDDMRTTEALSISILPRILHALAPHYSYYEDLLKKKITDFEDRRIEPTHNEAKETLQRFNEALRAESKEKNQPNAKYLNALGILVSKSECKSTSDDRIGFISEATHPHFCQFVDEVLQINANPKSKPGISDEENKLIQKLKNILPKVALHSSSRVRTLGQIQIALLYALSPFAKPFSRFQRMIKKRLRTEFQSTVDSAMQAEDFALVFEIARSEGISPSEVTAKFIEYIQGCLIGHRALPEDLSSKDNFIQFVNLHFGHNKAIRIKCERQIKNRTKYFKRKHYLQKLINAGTIQALIRETSFSDRQLPVEIKNETQFKESLRTFLGTAERRDKRSLQAWLNRLNTIATPGTLIYNLLFSNSKKHHHKKTPEKAIMAEFDALQKAYVKALQSLASQVVTADQKKQATSEQPRPGAALTNSSSSSLSATSKVARSRRQWTISVSVDGSPEKESGSAAPAPPPAPPLPRVGTTPKSSSSSSSSDSGKQIKATNKAKSPGGRRQPFTVVSQPTAQQQASRQAVVKRKPKLQIIAQDSKAAERRRQAIAQLEAKKDAPPPPAGDSATNQRTVAQRAAQLEPQNNKQAKENKPVQAEQQPEQQPPRQGAVKNRNFSRKRRGEKNKAADSAKSDVRATPLSSSISAPSASSSTLFSHSSAAALSSSNASASVSSTSSTTSEAAAPMRPSLT